MDCLENLFKPFSSVLDVHPCPVGKGYVALEISV